MDQPKLHIVMFPWLAFGHMIPYLELAKLIAKKGHKISFISTPKNIDRLPHLPPNLSSLITFVKLPLPRVPNLPESAEATIDLPEKLVRYLKRAYDALQEPLTQFLQISNPDWLLFDFPPYWLPAIARNLGISTAFYCVLTPACLCFMGHTSQEIPLDNRKTPEDYTVPPKWIPFPTTLSLRLFEILRVLERAVTGDEGNVSDTYRVMEGIKGCDAIAIRSCMEFEPEWLRLVEDLHRKPVLPVGLLSPTDYDVESYEWGSVKVWLDSQPKGSVVYVAFGSEAVPSQDDITKISLGLERSELPFFWVLRTKRGSDLDLVKLPEGFEERTGGRGVVCRGWAPQVKILSHDSVGVFLSHSGGSSVVEALTFGRALVLLTMLNDQGLNAKVLEEKKIGYLIPRDDQDGSFTSDSVAESLRLVVEKEEGRVYRDKAKELKSLFADRERQDMYTDNFLEYLKTHRRRSGGATPEQPAATATPSLESQAKVEIVAPPL